MADSTPYPSGAIRVAVIGGGISGLAAAYFIRRSLSRVELRVLEASDRLGGPLHTLRSGELVLEQGADSFLIKTPYALDLCRELGLADRLVPTGEKFRRALVVRGGKLLPVPDGFVLMKPQNLPAIMSSPVLSLAGKLRLLAEPLMRSRRGLDDPAYDESVASFATRRLGREAFERLVEPLVAGIYVADARKLSLAATFPEFIEAERTHGSLWRSCRAARLPGKRKGRDANAPTAAPTSAARYGQFVTLEGGLRVLVDALAAALPAGAARLGTPVRRLERRAAGRWTITPAGGEPPEHFDGVVVAASTGCAASLIRPWDAELASRLEQIQYASSAVVTLVYRRDQIAHPLDGFGAVVPAVEQRPIVAASFLHVKLPTHVPKGLAVIRVFSGGVLHPETVDRDDQQLIATAKQQLAELVGASGDPRETHVARWRNSMPQYEVGHVQLASEIERRVAAHDGLQLAGNGYHGVGIPHCIHTARAAAQRLVNQLKASRRL